MNQTNGVRFNRTDWHDHDSFTRNIEVYMKKQNFQKTLLK